MKSMKSMKQLFANCYFGFYNLKSTIIKILKVPYYYFLFLKYPFLDPCQTYKWKKFHLCYYTYSLLDCMPKGWNKAFGMKMAKEIDKWLKENMIKDYCVTDVICTNGLKWVDNAPITLYRDVILKYEELSRQVCIVCGKPVEYVTKGTMAPYCGKCAEKDTNNSFIKLA